MQVRTSITSLSVVVAALAVTVPVAAQQKVESKEAASACTLALTPQALKVQADPFQVKAVLSQAIGQIGAATIQEENSGLQVTMAPAEGAEAAQPQTPAPAAPSAKPSAQPAPAGPAAAAPAAASQAIQLTLNAATAKPGDWTIAVRGENGTCTGRIHVGAGEPKQ